MRSFMAVLLLCAYSSYTFGKDDDDWRPTIAGVVSNGRDCAAIGRNILREGGNAIDSGVGVLLCEGVTGPQSMGIGGGFLATVYIKSKHLVTTINAREAAPKNVSESMFKGLKKIKGGHATAIPSEIKGYWELKQRYGNPNYPWKKIFEPTIKLCEKGYKVDYFLASILKLYEKEILAEPTLSEIFVNSDTKQVFKEGETAFRLKLGETLRQIANNGAKEFYGGPTGQKFIDDVREMGGILTMQDLIDYEVKEKEPVAGLLEDGLTLYTVPLPGSGAVLNEILQLLKGRVKGLDDANLIHRIVEAMKHAYGLRSKLADSDYEPSARQALIEASDWFVQEKLRKKITKDENKTHNEVDYYGGIFDQKDHGTSNLAVIDEDGNAITATSTVNNVFGAFVRSRKTGIILNDEMDDFSTPNVTNAYGYPPSQINFIKAGKRPMSSMCPSIVLNKKGKVRLLIGAAGGSQITTSVAQTIVRHLFLGMSLSSAINEVPRFHHQLIPNKLMLEKGRVNEDVKQKLREKGHELQEGFIIDAQGFSAVTGISVIDGETYPVFDIRRGGSGATTDGWEDIY